jgi:hypothetical protein
MARQKRHNQAQPAASHFRPVTAAQRRVLVVVVEAAHAGKLPTQKEVASIASVSEGQVSRWNRDPEWRKAVALAYDEAREGAWRRAELAAAGRVGVSPLGVALSRRIVPSCRSAHVLPSCRSFQILRSCR